MKNKLAALISIIACFASLLYIFAGIAGPSDLNIIKVDQVATRLAIAVIIFVIASLYIILVVQPELEQ